jgi:hypothetical protein
LFVVAIAYPPTTVAPITKPVSTLKNVFFILSP